MRAIWTDRGGTFTDILRQHADGRVEVSKVLSDRLDGDAVAVGAGPSTELRRGTTVATNALLERTGAPVLLLTTRGFADAPWIGDQVRPELFGLRQPRPAPLCTEVIEVDGRIAAPRGDAPAAVLSPHRVDPGALAAARRRGVDSVAVVLVNGQLAPAEERGLAARCRAAGFGQVSLGCEVAPSRGFLDRLHTTLADAALSPLLPRARGEYIKSDGGLAPVDETGRGEEWRGCHAVLSGPSGGVVATARLAARAGVGAAFGFDMGGTSTDVCRVEGRPDRVDHITVGGVRLRVPAVQVETVAAGGGSILSRRGGAYVSGPASAGASPGPAAYGRGGPATVTDCAAVLGLLPDFPPVAGPDRDQPLDIAAARRRLRALDPDRPVEEVAEGFQRVAVEQMARAVRRLAAARGVDPGNHCLVAFGGAGPGHACAVARALGIRTVLVPLLAGVFSAVGIGLARHRAARTAPVSTTLGDALEQLRAALDASGIRGDDQRQAVLRYRGTSEGLEVPLPGDPLDPAIRASTPSAPADPLVEALHAAHRRLMGFDRPDLPVELVEIRGVREQTGPARDIPVVPLPPRPATTTRAWFDGAWRRAPLRDATDAGGLLGPAVLRVHGATVVVAPGFVVSVHADHLRLDDVQRPPPPPVDGAPPRAHRDLRDPLDGDRRADGRAPGAPGALGEHPRAPRLLLRDLRRTGAAGGQRPPRAGAPGRHGRHRPRPAGLSRRRGAPGHRLGEQRPLRRRVPPARHHRGHAGVRGTATRGPGRLPRPPRRCRRHHARLHATPRPRHRRGGSAAPPRADPVRRTPASPGGARSPRRAGRQPPARRPRRRPRRAGGCLHHGGRRRGGAVRGARCGRAPRPARQPPGPG